MPGSPFEARVKLTALLFWTALTLTIAGELDVPLAVAVAVPVAVAEGVDDPVLELLPPRPAGRRGGRRLGAPPQPLTPS